MEKRNVIREDGVLVSSEKNQWKPSMPKGSFYKELINKLNQNLNNYGDWDWLVDCMTGEVTKARFIPHFICKKFFSVKTGFNFLTKFVPVFSVKLLYPSKNDTSSHSEKFREIN